MSQQLISRSPDLKRLLEEGYDVSIFAGHLVLRDVPYLDEHRRVRKGVLAAPLRLAADRTLPPNSHQIYFVGALPCDFEGRPLVEMLHVSVSRQLGPGLVAEHMFCSRPATGEFPDYHTMMTTFVSQLSNHAVAVDPAATARTHHVTVPEGDASPFSYLDTASSRAGIAGSMQKLAGQRIAIVGLGGTGGYILDLVAKTAAARIHLFDDDRMEQHNAFRAPGAASLADLAEGSAKVDYFDRIYSRMHRNIIPHRTRLSPSTFQMLDHIDFVFLSTDTSSAKEPLVRELERRELPFIDAGMGLHVTEAGLVGTVRVTTSTPEMRSHVWDRCRIPMARAGNDDPYATNIQIADLNMLNAALAVIRWKRWSGFYVDLDHEHFSTFAIDGNHLLNEDRLS